MANLSSTTLFNFTDNIKHLIDNLEKGIYCHNTFEKLYGTNNGYRIPMACFCDIPLSLTEEHFDWYGEYGIGINRTYARNVGLQPVWYVLSENNLVKNLIKNKNNLTNYEKKYIIPYLKKFIGKQSYKSKGLQKGKKFYNEHEWRYIPKGVEVELFFNYDSQPESFESGYRMPLDLSKVEYIMVERESDIKELQKKLPKILSKQTGSKVSIEFLLTKVLTAKQIRTDF